MARLWRPVETFLEIAACTLARYALRVIDRSTGIPYSADELKAWILADVEGGGGGGGRDITVDDNDIARFTKGGTTYYFAVTTENPFP